MKRIILQATAFIVAVCAASALAAAPRDATKAEIGYVQKGMVERLKDPESARYTNVQIVTGDDGVLTVCGSVNSKNSYGGYAGASRFMGILSPENKSAFIVGIDTPDKPFIQLMCSQKGM